MPQPRINTGFLRCFNLFPLAPHKLILNNSVQVIQQAVSTLFVLSVKHTLSDFLLPYRCHEHSIFSSLQHLIVLSDKRIASCGSGTSIVYQIILKNAIFNDVIHSSVSVDSILSRKSLNATPSLVKNLQPLTCEFSAQPYFSIKILIAKAVTEYGSPSNST